MWWLSLEKMRNFSVSSISCRVNRNVCELQNTALFIIKVEMQ